MWGIIVLVVAIGTHGSHALSDAEIEKFEARSTGACNNELTVTKSDDGDYLTFETNSLPDHMWGCMNPNPAAPQDNSWTVPNNPTKDSNGPRCLMMGAVGIALNGVPFYNPLNADNINAVEGDDQESFDCCDGHPDFGDDYHYHKLPQHDITTDRNCDNPIYDQDTTEPKLVGVALDGFPIYTGWEDLDEDDLDECHGTTLPDGETYAYIASYGAQGSDTFNFPYIMGCYWGTVGYPPCSKVCSGSDNTPEAGKNQMCSCTVGVVQYNRGNDTTTILDSSCAKKKRSSLDVHMEKTLARRATVRLGRTADTTCYSYATCTEPFGSTLDYDESSDQCTRKN